MIVISIFIIISLFTMQINTLLLNHLLFPHLDGSGTHENFNFEISTLKTH